MLWERLNLRFYRKIQIKILAHVKRYTFTHFLSLIDYFASMKIHILFPYLITLISSFTYAAPEILSYSGSTITGMNAGFKRIKVIIFKI